MREIFFLPERCLPGCNACQMACVAEHLKNKGLLSPLSGLPFPKKRQTSLYTNTLRRSYPHPLRCLHCDPPRCVEACLSGSLIKNDENGRVGNNLEKCIGCFMCVAQCPYGAVIPTPTEHVSIKCDGCLWSKAPACVRACPTGALIFSDKETLNEKLEAQKRFKKRVIQPAKLMQARA
ncbi:MAG: 4Fe-4S dicluster domain-containing protein [Deltaproteobacteria bacterium]|nr:4Fe-4S dicluster domain-containing protein [Deltaproteobacteria bacterium]